LPFERFTASVKGGDPPPEDYAMVSVRFSVLATFAILLPAVAAAQDSVTEFRLAQDAKKIQGCTAMDPSFTRVHTLTIKGGQAEIKSAGGIDAR
jgi:hypothetical protein